MPAIRNSPSTRRASSRFSRSSSLSTSPSSRSSPSAGLQTPPSLTWHRITFVQNDKKLSLYEDGVLLEADGFGDKENQPIGDSMTSPPSTPLKKYKGTRELALDKSVTVGPFHVSLFPQVADLCGTSLGLPVHSQDVVRLSLTMARGEHAEEENINMMLDKVNDALDAAAAVFSLNRSFAVESILADARAKELTESPLSDVSEAFYTPPSSFPSSPTSRTPNDPFFISTDIATDVL